jgi:hypothetical protein
MTKMRDLQHEDERNTSSLKAVVPVTVIGIVASLLFAFEAPRPNVASDEPIAMMADVYLTADGPPPANLLGAQASPETGAQAHQRASAIASSKGGASRSKEAD